MKSPKMKISTLIIFILGSITIYSQVPQGFNYQGVARDADDKVISDDFISLRMAIVQGSASGNVVYLETHSNVATSAQGVFSLIVGGGTTNDDFTNIDWAASSYFLRVDMDINNGTDFERMGASQLLSVPYALHAGSAASGGNSSGDGDDDPTNELQNLVLTGNTLGISGGNSVTLTDNVNDSDADPNNELQSLNINGNQLSISGGNTVNLPVAEGSGDNWGSQVVESDVSINGNGTSSSPLSVNGDLTDDQSLSVSGNQLSISGGNTVNLPVSEGSADNWGTQIVESDGTLTGDGTSASPLSVNGDLSDDQTLGLSGNELSISGGNSVTLTDNVNDADADPTNELITNLTLTGNNLSIEESSQVRIVDLSPLLTGSASLWRLSGNSIFYDSGEVFFGNPTSFNSNIILNNNSFRINGIEGTEVTFDTEKLSFDPIGFTPSLGSADYRRNGFEIFSGSGLETRLTDALLEIVEGDNIMHLQPDNLHFHTATGDGVIYGNLGIGSSGANFSITADNVGINTNNPELELHIQENNNGNFQLYLENGSNDWLLGAERGNNNLLFKLRSNDNFTFLNGNTLSFGAVSDKRYKKNIRDQKDVLNQIMDLKVKQFEYIGSDESTIGLIAQDVQTVFPFLVTEFNINNEEKLNNNDVKTETVLGLNYTQLTFLNTKAIQEQQEIINSQKEEINELRMLLIEMQKEIEKLKE